MVKMKCEHDYLRRDLLSRIMLVITIVLSLITIYQIMRHLLGGSWAAEGLIIAMLGINMTMTFSQGKEITQLQVEMQHLRHDVDSFKINEFGSFKTHVEKRFDKIETRLSMVGRGMEKINYHLERMEQLPSRFHRKRA